MRKGKQLPWIVSDELWAGIEPLLPVVQRRTDHPGRRRLRDRKVLSGILFVLHTGIPWEFLPQELGFGSGMTCWRRPRDWNGPAYRNPDHRRGHRAPALRGLHTYRRRAERHSAGITAMPHRMDLPALGAFVSGEVIWHAAHNHQVKVRLDEWLAADE